MKGKQKRVLALLLVALMVLFNVPFMGFAAPAYDGTSAQGVTPVFHAGNNKGDFHYSPSDFSDWKLINGVEYKVTEGKFLQWRAVTNLPGSIIVKGGNDYYQYNYANALFADDSKLSSPLVGKGNIPDISHISVTKGPKINPSISLVKTVSPTVSTAGAVVVYTFVVTNTGDVPLSGVELNDELIEYTKEIGTLAKGQQVTFEQKYVLGTFGESFTNTAEVVGHYGDIHVEDQDTAVVKAQSDTVNLKPHLSILKTVDRSVVTVKEDEIETVVFTVTVTNDGDMDLENVIVTDPQLKFEEEIDLGVGKSASFNIEHSFTLADLGNQKSMTYTNTAYAEVVEVFNKIEASASVTVNKPEEVVIEKNYGLVIEKKADVESGIAPFDVVYTITVTNDGDYDLKGVVVEDELLDFTQTIDLKIDEVKVLTVPKTTLTIEDRNQGNNFVNTATATVKTDGNNSLSVKDEAVVEIQEKPPVLDYSLKIEKTSNVTSGIAPFDAVYTLTVTNNGKTKLTNVVVTDPKLDFESLPFDLEINEVKVLPLLTKRLTMGDRDENNTFVNTAYATVTVNDSQTINVQDDAVIVIGSPGNPPVENPPVENPPVINPPNDDDDEPVVRRTEVVPNEPNALSLPVVVDTAEDNTVDVPTEEVPEALPLALPKTGELPATLFYGFGGLISAIGVYLRRK